MRRLQQTRWRRAGTPAATTRHARTRLALAAAVLIHTTTAHAVWPGDGDYRADDNALRFDSCVSIDITTDRDVGAGVPASASGPGATAVGSAAAAFAHGAALGSDTYVEEGATGVGAHARALAGSMALGALSAATASQALAAGTQAVADCFGAVALGAGAHACAPGAVALGHSACADEPDTVSVGAADMTRRLVRLADGVDAQDAATVAQLQSALAALERRMRTAASMPAAATWPADSAPAPDAGAAPAAGSSVAAPAHGGARTGSGAATASAAAPVPTGATDGARANTVINLVNNDWPGVQRVAARASAAALAEAREYTDTQVAGSRRAIAALDRSTRRGIAAAAALQQSTPYVPGRLALNAGVAGYRDAAAIAVTLSRWNHAGTFNVNMGLSSAGARGTIVRAGLGMLLD
jgi:autotransporter adhesin